MPDMATSIISGKVRARWTDSARNEHLLLRPGQVAVGIQGRNQPSRRLLRKSGAGTDEPADMATLGYRALVGTKPRPDELDGEHYWTASLRIHARMPKLLNT